VVRLDFKSSWGRQPFPGQFDSVCLPPVLPPSLSLNSRADLANFGAKYEHEIAGPTFVIFTVCQIKAE
jgi:hypothetical protein